MTHPTDKEVEVAKRIGSLKIDDATMQLIITVAGILYRARSQRVRKIKARTLKDILKRDNPEEYSDLGDGRLYHALDIGRDYFPLLADNDGHFWALTQDEWDRYNLRKIHENARGINKHRKRRLICVDDPPPQMRLLDT